LIGNVVPVIRIAIGEIEDKVTDDRKSAAPVALRGMSRRARTKGMSAKRYKRICASYCYAMA
jgi:hypothetical protein